MIPFLSQRQKYTSLPLIHVAPPNHNRAVSHDRQSLGRAEGASIALAAGGQPQGLVAESEPCSRGTRATSKNAILPASSASHLAGSGTAVLSTGSGEEESLSSTVGTGACLTSPIHKINVDHQRIKAEHSSRAVPLRSSMAAPPSPDCGGAPLLMGRQNSASMPLPRMLRAHRQASRQSLILTRQSTEGEDSLSSRTNVPGTTAGAPLTAEASGNGIYQSGADELLGSGAMEAAAVEYTGEAYSSGGALVRMGGGTPASRGVAAGSATPSSGASRNLGRSRSLDGPLGGCSTAVEGGVAVGSVNELQEWSNQQGRAQYRAMECDSSERVNGGPIMSTAASEDILVLGEGRVLGDGATQSLPVTAQADSLPDAYGSGVGIPSGDGAVARSEAMGSTGGGGNMMGSVVIPPEHLAWHDVEAIPVEDPVSGETVGGDFDPNLGSTFLNSFL